MGHNVIVVSPPGVDPFANSGAQNTAAKKSFLSMVLGWLSKRMPQFGFELMELAYNLVAYRTMKAVIAKNRIDLMYERFAFFSLAGAMTAKKNKLPLILEVNEVSGIKRNRGLIFEKLAKRIEHYIFERADAIITVSTFLKTRLQSMDIRVSKIHVVPNSVNIAEFDPGLSGDTVRELLKLQGKTTLGFMGSFSEWDRLDFLIDVFAEIAADVPDLTLVLIGDGFNRKQLEDNVRQRGYDDKILFAGRIPHSQVPHYIAALDIAVIPHSNPFGSPVVMFEYMAMGKPVIAPRLGPILEVLTNNENGLLFETGDAVQLKQHILSFYNSLPLREKIGSNARTTILSRHLWKYNAEFIIKLYMSAVNK